MAAGRFIVFEGLDGAGTSTQAALLAEWLRGRGISVDLTREPTDGEIGRLIRQVLSGDTKTSPAALALLFAADRIDHLERPDGVKAALAAGRWVISDRYVLSSVAYQSADGIESAWAAEINRHAITPDLTIFVDTTPEVCMRRIEARGGRREIFETLPRQRAVLDQFRAALANSALTGSLARVDGDGAVEAVTGAIKTAVETWLRGL